jgi:hypothetical protein
VTVVPPTEAYCRMSITLKQKVVDKIERVKEMSGDLLNRARNFLVLVVPQARFVVVVGSHNGLHFLPSI